MTLSTSSVYPAEIISLGTSFGHQLSVVLCGGFELQLQSLRRFAIEKVCRTEVVAFLPQQRAPTSRGKVEPQTCPWPHIFKRRQEQWPEEEGVLFTQASCWNDWSTFSLLASCIFLHAFFPNFCQSPADGTLPRSWQNCWDSSPPLETPSLSIQTQWLTEDYIDVLSGCRNILYPGIST